MDVVRALMPRKRGVLLSLAMTAAALLAAACEDDPTDPDDLPTVSWSLASQTNQESVATVTVTAQLSGGEEADDPVTVPFTVGTTSTATSPADYTVTTTSPITIAEGQSSATVTITVVNDTSDEPDETIILNMGTPTNATRGGTSVHTVTIADNDEAAPTPPTVSFSAAAQSIAESVATVTVTAQLSAASTQAVTVPFTIGAGTATNPADYTISASPITIPAGQTSGTATITVVNDTNDEPDETVILNMGTPTNATQGATTVHTVTITDNDNPPAAPTVAFTAASQSSGEAVATVTVTAQLSAAAAQNVTVPFTIGAGTAANPADYTITASPITILAGQLTGTATITVVNDTDDEPDETIIVNMGAPTNATQGATTVHTVTITDNDGAPGVPTVSFTVASQSSAEDVPTVIVTAQLSAAAAQNVTVPFTIGVGTATNPTDYTISASPITIPAGQLTGSATVSVVNDTDDEPDETIIVNMGAPTNATQGATTVHTVTITDNDVAAGAPTVVFTAAAQSAAESVGVVTITAQLSAVSAQNVTVPFTVAGTATSGTDFSISASPITIVAGQLTGTVTIAPVNDADDEPNETVIVTMGAPTNATLGATTVHTATLTDDDP